LIQSNAAARQSTPMKEHARLINVKDPPSIASKAPDWTDGSSSRQARSAYDGSWGLVFVTQRGACEPSYNFTVNVSDGIVSHPNLVKFRGHVTRSARCTRQSQFMTNTPRVPASSPAPRARARGAVAPGTSYVRAIGPLNEIERTSGDCALKAANLQVVTL